MKVETVKRGKYQGFAYRIDQHSEPITDMSYFTAYFAVTTQQIQKYNITKFKNWFYNEITYYEPAHTDPAFKEFDDSRKDAGETIVVGFDFAFKDVSLSEVEDFIKIKIKMLKRCRY